MDAASSTKLLALVATALVALGFGWLMTRWGRPSRLPPALRPGYPAPDFPRRDLIEAEPLRELCRAQRELLALHAELPAGSAGRSSALIFLEELRGVMDAAYELARTASTPSAHERLSQVVRDARTATQSMIDRIQRQLTAPESDSAQADLDIRLEVMRALANDDD